MARTKVSRDAHMALHNAMVNYRGAIREMLVSGVVNTGTLDTMMRLMASDCWESNKALYPDDFQEPVAWPEPIVEEIKINVHTGKRV